MTAGLYVGALVVATLQYLRFREPRLLPLVGLLAMLAGGHARAVPPDWAIACHIGAGMTAIVLVFAVSPRPRG